MAVSGDERARGHLRYIPLLTRPSNEKFQAGRATTHIWVNL